MKIERKQAFNIFECLANLSIDNSRNTSIYTFNWHEKKMSDPRNSHIFKLFQYKSLCKNLMIKKH